VEQHKAAQKFERVYNKQEFVIDLLHNCDILLCIYISHRPKQWNILLFNLALFTLQLFSQNKLNARFIDQTSSKSRQTKQHGPRNNEKSIYDRKIFSSDTH
jgi:hypothetical protein